MLLYILIAILMFGLLIAVHEFGHFFTAKLLGVRVNEFAIGMGPLLWSKQKGETQYSLRAIPVGGFCAMEGEDDDSNDPKAFNNKPAWKKLLILVAGAFMNFVTGVLLILVVFSLLGSPPAPIVVGYMEGGEHIAQAGILPGDQFYRIDGHRIYFGADANMFLFRAGDQVEVEVVRDGQRIDLGLLDIPARIPAEENGETVYKRGIVVGVQEEASLGRTLRNTWYQAIDYVRMVWISLGDLVTGAVGIKDMSGPIGIVNMVGQAGESGAQAAVKNDASPAVWAMIYILRFVAFIAVNLAVMNLLPIPALDGGRILFLAVNGIFTLFTRKKLDPKYEGYVNAAGLICLLALMAVVAFNDVVRLIH